MSYRPITDLWILARPKHRYYGAFPAGYLQRGRDLLGVTMHDSVLHVCSGKIKDYPFRGLGARDRTVDIDPALKPDFCMNVAKELPKKRGGWAAVLADPPYSEADADQYPCGRAPYPSPQLLLSDCLRVVRPGGRVGVLHYEWPRHPKTLDGVRVRSVALVAIAMGQGNKGRFFSVFERMD